MDNISSSVVIDELAHVVPSFLNLGNIIFVSHG
jgi:hypothetical protein